MIIIISQFSSSLGFNIFLLTYTEQISIVMEKKDTKKDTVRRAYRYVTLTAV